MIATPGAQFWTMLEEVLNIQAVYELQHHPGFYK